MRGQVKAVTEERLGGEVISIVGQVAIMDSAIDFEEEGGTLLSPGGPLTYIATDYDASTVTFPPPPPTISVDDWLAPYSFDHEDKNRVAQIDVGEGDPLIADVPQSLWLLLPPGIRTPGSEEVVEVEDIEDRVVIKDVLGRKAELARYLEVIGLVVHSPADGAPDNINPVTLLVESNSLNWLVQVWRDTDFNVDRAYIDGNFAATFTDSVTIQQRNQNIGAVLDGTDPPSLTLGESVISEQPHGLLLLDGSSRTELGKILILGDYGDDAPAQTGNRVAIYNKGGALFWRGSSSPHAL